MKKIKSVLVANRGEPVRRAKKTLRRLGLGFYTIAVSEDVSSPWVAESDGVIEVSSYLAADEIILAAQKLKVDAIWPAWGFLSEKEDFAAKVEQAGLIWIGPSSKVIAMMGSKSTATAHAKNAGLQTIPEVVIEGTDAVAGFLSKAKAVCDSMGYPLLLKPALGGGGQGQEILYSSDDVANAWVSVCLVNAKQFGQGPVLVQKYFTQARHIEAQVLGDKHGQLEVLGERDCSMQRRNQKVIEEAPSPALTEEIRRNFYLASQKFAKSIGYDSAGTIEYLYQDEEFYFLEMNTRLQVEHTVTEESTRVKNEAIDLLEQMILVAQGDPLAFSTPDIKRVGHAIEARIYAEDPTNNFRPSPGVVCYLQFPRGENIRVESAMGASQGVVHPLFDPMIAKLIVCGGNRAHAIKNLQMALRESTILGVNTNLSFCDELVAHPDFVSGNYSTRFITEHPHLRGESHKDLALVFMVTSILCYSQDLEQARAEWISPVYTSLDRVLKSIPKNGGEYRLTLAGRSLDILVQEVQPKQFVCQIFNHKKTFILHKADKYGCSFVDDQSHVFQVWSSRSVDEIQLSINGIWSRLKVRNQNDNRSLSDPHASPMSGQLVGVLVVEGQEIESGQPLYQVESMKMVTTISSQMPLKINRLLRQVGEGLKTGDVLFDLTIKANVDDANIEAQWSQEQIQISLPAFTYASEHLFYYLLGFDAEPNESAISNLTKEPVEKIILLCCRLFEAQDILSQLFGDFSHTMTHLLEQGFGDGRWMPQTAKDLLTRLAQVYGPGTDFATQPRLLVHILQGQFCHVAERKNVFSQIIALLAKDLRITKFLFTLEQNQIMAKGLFDWIKSNPKLEIETQILVWLAKLSPKLYDKLGRLPVALEYLDEYNGFLKNPVKDIKKLWLAQTQSLLLSDKDFLSPAFLKLNMEYQNYFIKWFEDFLIREIELPELFSKKDVCVYEAMPTLGDRLKSQRRYIVVAQIQDSSMKRLESEQISLPGFERGAITAYHVLRILQGLSPHEGNHVFLLADPQNPIPWKTRADESSKPALTPEIAKQVATRVSGFADEIKVMATEVVMPLVKVDTEARYLTIIEVRHAKPSGVMSRPPFIIEERKPEVNLDAEKQLNENQHRMGKLINPDRAFLLFDEGQFEELFFPEVDFDKDIGLNVYQGKVGGKPVMVYASDFRKRGGALGEREGKKLAATVVLAYLTQHTLVAFHDGAGANIKESVASLGWAGAYFGAIAHTGGFGHSQKFKKWYKGHLNRAYFELVLNHFGYFSLDRLLEKIERPLLHFHGHVGATVGMLVYGASIAHLSLMNDQPESYRVLTGSATVQRVLGEKATNYQLGGAMAHGVESGDIEMVLPSEDALINQIRRLIKLFIGDKKTYPNLSLLTHVGEILPQAGVLISRDILKQLVDDGEFFETREKLRDAKGLLTGYTALQGLAIAFGAMTTDYGLSTVKGFKKAMYLVTAAHDLQCPLVLTCGSHAEAPISGASDHLLYARAEFLRALQQLTKPKISVALGATSIEQNIHTLVDLTLYIPRGQESEFDQKRAQKYCAMQAKTWGEAFLLLSQLLRFITTPDFCAETDSPDRLCKFDLPPDVTQSYDMRLVLADIFDKHSVFELWRHDSLPLIVGLARLNGRSVGFIADNPAIESGAQNVESIAKFTKLHRLCARFHLPIIELSDSPAFRPGSEQEHGGIQGEGGKSIREECLSDIKKIVVTLRQNYGGRLIHANLNTLGPDRQGFILEGARVGVMGAKGAAVVLFRKKLATLPESERAQAEADWIAHYEKVQVSPKKAVELGYMQNPIPLGKIRQVLIQALVSV